MESDADAELDRKSIDRRSKKRSGSRKKYHQHRKRGQDNLENFKFDISGVQRIALSEKTQRDIGLLVGEDVTSESPWKLLKKETLEDHIEMAEDSEFKSIRLDISPYPRPQILMGYAPDETREYDEFYIVLLETSEDIISDVIRKITEQREAKLARAMAIVPKGYWPTFGSEQEIREYTDRTSRALYEVEIETAYPIMSPKVQFKNRSVDSVRDGYAELLQGKTPIVTVSKMRIDAVSQAAPTMISQYAQTRCTYPKNAWTQYFYEYAPVTKLTQDFEKCIKHFVDADLDDICDKIRVNDHINFYTDDYMKLITDPEYAKEPPTADWSEYMSFADLEDARNKLITSACWHPMWTGTIVISYGDKAPNTFIRYPPTTDPVNTIVYGVTPILIWCMNDGLYPKLQLECSTPIDCISICPYEENLIVGGLSNGQIVLWDIRNRISKVEEEEILTSAQQKYRVLMWSLMDWFKNIENVKRVRVTAHADPSVSHSMNVTRIIWLSPYYKITKTGQAIEIEEGEPTTLQFCTSSIDGTLLFWDLLAKPIVHGEYRAQRKLRRLKVRPSALMVDISPFRCLNRALRPHYKLTIFHQKKSKGLPVASADLIYIAPVVVYEKADPKQPDSMTERVIYKPVMKKPPPPIKYAVCGSSNGYVFSATWEGYDVNPGNPLNNESVKVTSIGRYHDGPVHTLDRNTFVKDTHLSIGGRMFAIWRIDFKNRPVLWRKSRTRYLHGHWAKGNPSMLRLSRRDGSREVWSLLKRTDKLYYEQNMSGERVLGSFVHPRPLPIGILGIADNNGAFRMFGIPILQEEEIAGVQLTEMLDREVFRKKEFMTWQENWLKDNQAVVQENIDRRAMKHEKLIEKEKKEQHRLIEERLQLEREQKIAEKKNLPQPGFYREWAHEQWKIKEEERMKRVLLVKKQLNPKLLVKQQTPLKLLEKEEERKKKKQKERLAQSEKIFTDTVAMLFPDVIKKQPPPPLNPYEGGFPEEVKEECYHDFVSTCEEGDHHVATSPFIYHFDWKRVVQQGANRKREIQSQYAPISHKERLNGERRCSLPNISESRIDVNKIISKPSVSIIGEEDEDQIQKDETQNDIDN